MSCSVYLNRRRTNLLNPRTADFQMIDASNLKQLKIWTNFAGKFCSKTELFLDLGPEMAPGKEWCRHTFANAYNWSEIADSYIAACYLVKCLRHITLAPGCFFSKYYPLLLLKYYYLHSKNIDRSHCFFVVFKLTTHNSLDWCKSQQIVKKNWRWWSYKY